MARRGLPVALLALVVLGSLWAPTRAAGPQTTDCPGNLLANPGFEWGGRKTESLGTSLSSYMANGWYPWSILGDETHNREVEYKLEDVQATGARYRIHSGRYAMKFFTTWATHTAGFYQRVKVPRGALVTFSIWVQIYTGERDLLQPGGIFISDLEKGAPGQAGPGDYCASVGIDPTGATPRRFSAPPPASVIWSQPVLDRDTRHTRADGTPYDAYVQLTISAIAEADYVTVYTRGQPQWPVKHNDSFWDDACLTAVMPTATPTASLTPTASTTPTPTATLTPSPTATATPMPTPTPTPAATERLVAALKTPGGWMWPAAGMAASVLLGIIAVRTRRRGHTGRR